MEAKARGDFLELVSAGVAVAMAVTVPCAVAEGICGSRESTKAVQPNSRTFEVMAYGATGDGMNTDTPVNALWVRGTKDGLVIQSGSSHRNHQP
jgi:hypothetical protein